MKSRYVPSHYQAREYKDANAIIYFAETNGAYYAMAYSGKRSKHDFHYKFKTLENFEKYVSDYLKRLMLHEQHKAEAKEKKAAIRKAFINPLKVGDIVYTSWGWEQTNIDFYQIVELIGKSTVKLRKLKCQDVGNEQGHCMSATKIPLKDQFWQDEILTKRVVPLGTDGCCLHLSSFETAFVWDGRPKNYSWYG